ncbi:WSC-domain-containing protein [Xylariaceae sp. FL0662B]|nr:WSC-domain-containing protein [Xylariaceae sp. FL0662B]
MATLLSSLRAMSLLCLLATGNTYPNSLEARQAISIRQGCFIDNTDGQRALSADSFGDDAMTVEKCSTFCRRYKLFGLEYGRECWCGDTRATSSTQVNDSDCSFFCSGNPRQKCGASNRLDVYSNGAYSPRKPAALPDIPYTCCFVDNGDPHPLPNNITSQGDMIAAKCAQNCAGYKYFGTEYGRECYCGNIPPLNQVPESECSLPCSGNDDELCGAGLRLSVYGGVGSYLYHGCHIDSGSNHALTGGVLYSPNMTLQLCAGFCSEYGWFGVEYGTQCFCGTSHPSSGEAAPTECNMGCAGNGNQACGGANRISVFYDPARANITVFNKARVGVFEYTSCWIDRGEARTLSGKVYRNDEMMVESCAAFCAAYTYFGVEYSTECYCGNSLANLPAPENDCRGHLCGGNADEWCGAANRLNIYTKSRGIGRFINATVRV